MPGPPLAASPAPTGPSLTLHHALLTLEQRLLTPEHRQNPAAVALLLAEEFREVGKSGRTYSRAEILALLAEEAPHPTQMKNFTASSLGPEAALATYDSISETGEHAHRSSVWIYRQGRWQLLYHQGTVAATDQRHA